MHSRLIDFDGMEIFLSLRLYFWLMDPADDPRVYMAAERTYLAWVRTGVALMGFGFVVARFGLFLRELSESGAPITEPKHAISIPIGVALVVLGILVTVAAAIRHRHYVRTLRLDAFASGFHSRVPLFISGVLALIGATMAGYLALF